MTGGGKPLLSPPDRREQLGLSTRPEAGYEMLGSVPRPNLGKPFLDREVLAVRPSRHSQYHNASLTADSSSANSVVS